MLAENISQFAWVARPDGRVVWYNKRFHEFAGLTPEDLTESPRAKLIPAEHLARVSEHFERSIAAGEDWEDTFPMRGKDGELRWFLSHAKPIRDESGKITWWFGTNTDVTEQREQADQIQLLLMEVNHRSKNMLSTVQALARRSVGDNPRIHCPVRGTAALDRGQSGHPRAPRVARRCRVRELIEAQLAFLPGKLAAVSLDGSNCALVPRVAEVLGMALHELATNSLKYGALSVEQGRVAIRWECPPARDGFVIHWTEQGGPPVAEPERAGFGTTLIREVPRHNLRAEVELDYRPDGLRWSLACGAEAIAHPQPAA